MEAASLCYDPENSIHDAAHAGDPVAVARLLDLNPNQVSGVAKGVGQPLHYAANADVAELLIGRGAEVDARDHQGHTPLHRAAQNGSLGVAEVLVDHGADLGARDDHVGGTPLYWAAHSPSPGSDEVARFLLGRGAAPDLNSALVLGMLDEARRLLDDPAAVTNAISPDSLPRTVVWVLFEAIGARVGPTEFALMFRSGEYDLDPVAVAEVMEERIDILDKILARRSPSGWLGFEALRMAVELPHPGAAVRLLGAGAGESEWARRDHAALLRSVGKSACKEAMFALLREHGIVA